MSHTRSFVNFVETSLILYSYITASHPKHGNFNNKVASVFLSPAPLLLLREALVVLAGPLAFTPGFHLYAPHIMQFILMTLTSSGTTHEWGHTPKVPFNWQPTVFYSVQNASSLWPLPHAQTQRWPPVTSLPQCPTSFNPPSHILVAGCLQSPAITVFLGKPL